MGTAAKNRSGGENRIRALAPKKRSSAMTAEEIKRHPCIRHGGSLSTSMITQVMPDIDLAAYFSRIAYSGPRQPNLAVLQALHAAHHAAIVYENIDVLLRLPVRLDVATLHAKMILGRRGGYCFEQNTYFQQVLGAMGFSVRAVAARVFWRALTGEVPPRNHMVILVTLDDGDYLADVGFGLLMMWAPLRLVPLVEQQTPIGVYRLMPLGSEFLVQFERKGRWAGRYELSMHEQARADWDVAHYYMSTHPNSPFTTNLMAARSKGGARYCLLNNKLQVHHGDGTMQRRILRTPEELEQVLRSDFDLPLAENCGRELARIAIPGSPPFR
jgi:N-hydroxyarylamine O-acetyltransferase